MLSHRNLYKELHLQPTASAVEIRSAYRRAALLSHPDKGGSTAAFHSIAFAFEVLSCPASRDIYDRAHHQWSNDNRHSTSRNSRLPRTTTTSQHGFGSRPKRKREPTTESDPAAKRKVVDSGSEEDGGMGEAQADDTGGEAGGDGDDPHPAPSCMYPNTFNTFEQLRNTLQDLAPAQRRDAISEMPQHVRRELLKYMSGRHTFEPRTNEDNISTRKLRSREESLSRGTDVRKINHVHQVSYQAQMRIRYLRMYTHSQAELDTAISHQMVLIQARHAINEAGDDIWNHPQEFCNVFNGFLANAGTSQEQLGLSVFIFMRADEWISRRATITSPVMPLQDAVAAHSRLMAARQTSWDKLRAEWVILMQQTQHARLHHLSRAQAEAVAENARLELLHRRLKQAVSAADRAISLHGRHAERIRKAKATLQQLAAKRKATAAAAEKRMSRKKNEQELLAARRRWYHRVDLTMEEILHRGAPQACP